MRSLLKQLFTAFYDKLLIYAVWLLVCVAVHTVILFYAGVAFPIAITDAAVSNVLIIFATFITVVSLRFYLPRKRTSLYIAIDLIAISIVVVLGASYLLGLIFSAHAAYLKLLDDTLLVRMLISALIASPVILRTLQGHREKENAEIALRSTEMEKQLRQAELAYLGRQLQPHFLFNSLNSVYALMGSRPDDARKMIQQLSEFLRSNLRKDDQQFVTLEEELHILQLYLNIERVRFGHRLSTPVVANEDALQLVLPPFILQPVVENAIKFGLYDTTSGVEISIRAKVNDGLLELQIENPFDAETARPRRGAGFGLDSIGRRLFLIYGRNDLLEAEAKGNVFSTRLKIPQPNA